MRKAHTMHRRGSLARISVSALGFTKQTQPNLVCSDANEAPAYWQPELGL